MVLVLMGVTGAGKTTVGEALAAELHWRFVDADEFHSPENVAKMHVGIPLDDADRTPWLRSLREAIVRWLQEGDNVVLACSALKDAYRRMLMVSSEVRFVYLRGDYKLIADRLAARREHYMNTGLLRSQFDALEEPQDVLTINVDKPVNEIVDEIRRAIGQ